MYYSPGPKSFFLCIRSDIRVEWSSQVSSVMGLRGMIMDRRVLNSACHVTQDPGDLHSVRACYIAHQCEDTEHRNLG